ncbi:MAG: 50S ribosomal protein L13 [Candidatus Lokiarchaeota archaeon]|jgi:large subunit ribosomal protein L13|nr:50S ribosomal protein L13 [Candidatus Lokiarchaeota archaeon]
MPKYHLLFDATDKILGRFCSQIAKKALLGEYIVIINAKDAIISGNKKDVFNKYLAKLNIRTSTNPTRGPFHKRRPDTFMKRVIKQMLPRKTIRGKEAVKRVHVFIGEIPERFKKRYQNLKPQEIPKCEKQRLFYYNKFVTLEELCDQIGQWKMQKIEV